MEIQKKSYRVSAVPNHSILIIEAYSTVERLNEIIDAADLPLGLSGSSIEGSN